jgi:hypothetical protein
VCHRVYFEFKTSSASKVTTGRVKQALACRTNGPMVQTWQQEGNPAGLSCSSDSLIKLPTENE